MPMKGDRTIRGFEHVGNAIFCGKVKRNKKEQGKPEAEDEGVVIKNSQQQHTTVQHNP
jgi:hypothetical protein